MKTHKHIYAILVALCLLSQGVFGQTIIGDNYWGGIPNKTNPIYQADRIGDEPIFELGNTQLTYVPDIIGLPGDDYLEIKITGNYFDNVINGYTQGTTLGDLFISTEGGMSWGAGGAPTLDDYIGMPGGKTSWEYGVQLGAYNQAQAGGSLGDGVAETGSLVKIGDPSNYTLSSGNTYREFQEHQIGAAVDGAWSNAYADPTWEVENGALTIKISDFSKIFTIDPNGTMFAFHWTMSCANDVIEFGVILKDGQITELPEPSTIGLLGIAGLVGFLAIRRRIRRK